MTGSDFFTSADPLLSANNSLFAQNQINSPPSPPWDENDLNDTLDSLVCSKDVDEFLSLSPESLRLDSETDEVISTFLTSEVVDFEDILSNNNNNEDPKQGLKPGHCSVCALVFSSFDLLEKHKAEFENQVKCCHCQKSFTTLSKLRTHHRKHSKEKPYECSICGKFYTHRNTLARHQLLYCRQLKIKTENEDLTKMILKAEIVLDQPKKHTTPCKRKSSVSSETESKVAKSGTSTKCQVCDSEFFDSESLENHRNYHLNNRECCSCHKVLGNKSKLLTHHRSHTKELPYNCSLCSKSFAELSTLRKHEATHGERNFRCDICSKAFVRKDYLSKHLLTHRQTFKCSQCSFICHNRQDIENHLSQEH